MTEARRGARGPGRRGAAGGRWRRLLFFLGAPLLMAASPADAPSPPAAVRSWGVPFLRVFERDDLMASPVSWQVALHPNGMVYVGNNLRLLEFDGVRWRGHRLSRTLAPDSLVIDAGGRIWAAVGEHLDRFVPQGDGSLVRESREDRLPEAVRAFGAFTRAICRPEGVYFMGERQAVLFRTDDTVQVWPAATALTSLWTMGDAVYVAQAGRGFARLERDGSLREEAVPGEVPPIFEGRAGGGPEAPRVLLTARGPMTWAGPGQPLVALSPATAVAFAAAPAVAAVALSDGRWAFGTERRGLVVVASSGEIEYTVDESHGLPSSRVNGLAEDAEGGLWLAQHNGLARVQVGLPYERLTGERGYRGSVRAVIRHRGRLYFGHADGVSVQDPATGRAERVADIPAATNGAICFLALGERLFASVSGIREITPDGRLRLVAPVPANSLTASRTHPGWIFAGTPGKGLWLLAPTEGGGFRVHGPVAGVPEGVVKVVDTGDGQVWGTAGNGTVWRADFRAGPRVDAPVERFGPERGAPATSRSDFRQIFALGGTVGASNDLDLLRFDAAAQRFAPETRWAGLENGPKPEKVEPAGDGTFWIQRGNGTAAGASARVERLVPDGPDRWRTETWPEGR